MSTGAIALWAAAAFGAQADAVRVSPATLPIPLPDEASRPLAPDRLRAQSPWTLSLAGDWRFQLAHGQILAGRFTSSDTEAIGLRSSGDQGGNPAENAFDGDTETRWCAPNGSFPQYLQARIDTDPRTVAKIEIAWERPAARYTCRIEGGNDGARWRTLLDRSSASGIGDGPLTVPASAPAVRYVRVVVLGASGGSWASIRELKIHYRKGGQDVVWHPGRPSRIAPAHADDFTQTSFDDHPWHRLSIPSNWEMAGYSIPTYDSVDDTVGLYRRWINVPRSWQGRRTYWRFDGVLDGAEIYVNGRRAGYHESGYTAFDVDLTGLIKAGEPNLLAVRVCKTTPSVDCETGDYQCMGGIYRDARLISVPTTHVSDLTVQTRLSADYKNATLQVSACVFGSPGETIRATGFLTEAATLRRLPVPLSGNAAVPANGTASLDMRAPVTGPRLWSAEDPALYYLTLEINGGGKRVERVEQRFGFRQVEIRNQIVLWNGKPIKCTGICRHDFWPNKGFALTDREWAEDLMLMKATNINAIRTSHYNHAARFLELCDERGFYVLDEVPFCWIGDKVKDPRFAAPLLQRAAETVARDKNRPCVLAWSLGNENPVGVDTQRVHDLVARLDPTRPSFASGAGPDSVHGQEIFDTHYPSPESVSRYVEKQSGIAPEVITEHPHTFYSRATQDYDPGASDTWSEGLIATWEKLWRSPTILGSFIWEWQSQGVADRFPDHTTDFYYGLEHMRQENNKGIMDAFRHPKAEQWIVKMVYSPVQFPTRELRVEHGVCVVPVVNRFAFTDLRQTTIRWAAMKDGVTLANGVAEVDCPPGESRDAMIAAPHGVNSLELKVDRPDGSNITVARLATNGATDPDPRPALTNAPALKVLDEASALDVTSAGQTVRFDKQTGALVRWTVNGRDRLQGHASFLNLGQAKAEGGDHYYHAPQFPVTDRASLLHEILPDGTVRVVSRAVVDSAGRSPVKLGVLTVTYSIHPTAEIGVRYMLEWTAPETGLWEFGLCFPLASGTDFEAWSRESYFSAYPAGHIGAPTGSAGPTDTGFRSSKRSLHFLTLTDKRGVGVALIRASSPLLGRAESNSDGTTLYASREVAAAGPDDLSWSWFHDHDILATPSKPLTGDFILRAINSLR